MDESIECIAIESEGLLGNCFFKGELDWSGWIDDFMTGLCILKINLGVALEFLVIVIF